MPAAERIWAWLAALAAALFCAFASAQGPCRIGFDIGSSGIRAGASNSETVTRISIDYLAALQAGRGLAEAAAPTIKALRDLPEQGGFDAACDRVGGGFSAWRLALGQDPARLVSQLAEIKAESGVGVLVIPQRVEGAYGYFGARRALGDRLTTSHILDIGGGSLQIAGERTTFGDALGQKIWHRRLCEAIRHTSTQPCALSPMTNAELAKARSLLVTRLKGVHAALPDKVTMTAISRPVTHGVAPAVERLLGLSAGRHVLARSELTAAIKRVAAMRLDETAERLGVPRHYAAYLLSDMLLVEGLMRSTGGNDLQVAELDMTNLPGLLADDIAFRWAGHYGCYLERLQRIGLDAYESDAATCVQNERP